MAALGALVKKVWSVRRFVVLLCAPLALVPVLLSLPPKVPGGGGDTERWRGTETTGRGARTGHQLRLPPRVADWGHSLRGTEQGTASGVH
ncbi:solute carrier family 13 member 3 [Limosa lapponica baueri]|uniref:Solute carrier family 13 member 3 n=1 Tax=Limosa lapponica baueri TaxID=1758121 RepID=A0A2I0T3A0_LIMLA|nr:solute carrier family 13 member 3 [Limosa lapponica baueri]